MSEDYIEILETVYCYAAGMDTRDWSLYRSIFLDEVEMDFESWDGIAPHRIRADDLAANIAVYFAGWMPRNIR
ncbi:MAG: nuclear transport factor 2 family protein [Gammaproteobacteria bacterium]|nr:nuclear transport factor 2 family protein [Gammaproteobacteria bacterium]